MIFSLLEAFRDHPRRELSGCDPTAAEIVPRFGILDPLLEQLAIALADALRSRTVSDGLFIDAVAQMMAVNLARTHSARSDSNRLPPNPPVSPRRVRRLIDFIEANLDDDLSLDAMAAEVGISPLYLARAFKKAIGQSPHQYVLARRIERAKELLGIRRYQSPTSPCPWDFPHRAISRTG